MAIRPYTRGQMWLLPPNLDDLIPMDHVVRFAASFVDQLDLRALGLRKVPAVRGGLSYRPCGRRCMWGWSVSLCMRWVGRGSVRCREARC